jgi:FkbM family methyltransferase
MGDLPQQRKRRSLKRLLIEALDRPGGRSMLAVVSTYLARRSDPTSRIFFDEVWHHRSGKYVFADDRRYRYYPSDFERWQSEVELMFQRTSDYFFHLYKPKSGDVVIDVGAGRGEDVLLFSELVGLKGRVIAIEADPNSYDSLVRLCRQNNLSNVTPLNLAVVDCAQKVSIEVGNGADSGAWYEHSILEPSGTAQTVQVDGKTLDLICEEEQVRHIDFLKMNIEGAEKLAVLGMSRTLASTTHVCICCHDFRADRGHGEWFRSREQVIPVLRAADFELALRESDPRDFVRDGVHGRRRKANAGA